MRRVSRMLVILLAALAPGVVANSVGNGAPARAASASPKRAASGMTVIGTGPVLPRGAKRVGLAPAKAHLRFELALRPRDPVGLLRFIREVSNPSSPLYRHYLRKGQFGRRFGPTLATIDKIIGRLRADGMHVGHVSANRLLIAVTTTVSVAEAAFRVRIGRYRLASRKVVDSNTGAPRVPSSIARYIQSIVGLDDLAVAAPAELERPPRGALRARARPGRSDDLAPGQPQPCAGAAGVTSSFTHVWTSDDIAQAYDFGPLYEAGDFGAGESIAVFGGWAYSASDVSAFQACYGTHVPIITEPVDGGNSTVSVEGTTDIETIVGLAPRLSGILFYEVPDNASDDPDEFSAIEINDGARVVNVSENVCEPVARAAGVISAEDSIFWAMAAQGQTVLVASGDTGAQGCIPKGFVPPAGATPSPSVDVNDPASQPWVTGVGGTNLNGLGNMPWSPPSETAWGGSGGGISQLWPMAPYQQHATAPGVINGLSSGVPCGISSVKGLYCREVPDVSANGGQWFVVYYGGSWSGLGGTSLSAPIWSALIALIDDSSARCRKAAVGFINPSLYQLAASTPADFNQITPGGSNNDYGPPGSPYPATSGYDMVTGLGSPAGANLAQSLCGGTLWSTPGNAGSELEVRQAPAIAAGGSDTTAGAGSETLYAALVDNSPGAPSFVYYGKTSNGGVWDYPGDAEVESGGTPSSTDDSPAIAILGGEPVVAWTDFATGKVDLSTLSGSGWSKAIVIGGGAATSDAGPALAGYGGDLFAAWKGHSTSNVYLSYDVGSGWTTPVQVPGASTDASPTITYYPDLAAVVMAWTTSGHSMNYAVYALLFGSFTASGTIPGASDQGPALTTLGDRLFAAWKGNGGEKVYYSAQPPLSLVGTWAAEQTIPEAFTLTSPALAVWGPTLFTAWTGNCGCSTMLWYSASDP
jgi:Pro-kumamolisin, activation domain